MSLPKSVRFDDELEKKVEAYLDQNPLKFSQLLAMAVEKFITEPQKIELRPVDSAKVRETAKKMFQKHKHTMDKLK